MNQNNKMPVALWIWPLFLLMIASGGGTFLLGLFIFYLLIKASNQDGQ